MRDRPDQIPMFEEWLKIDRNDLDTELVQQPERYYHVATAYVLAVSQQDQLKEEQKLTDAHLSHEVRGRLGGKDVRVTEAMVLAAVEAEPRHIEAREKLLKAEVRAERLLAMKEAFQQRSYVLKDLCQLYLHDYSAQTSVKGKDARALEDIEYEESRRRNAPAIEERQRRVSERVSARRQG